MATAIQLDARTMVLLDDLVATGRWDSPEQVVTDLVAWRHEQVANDLDADEPLTAEDIAAIERARADVRAGRTYSIDEVFDELERQHAAEQ